MAKQAEFLTPPLTLLCKLGSLMVHAEEYLSPNGHDVDKAAIEQLLADPEVQQWRAEMERAAMLPVKR